MFEPKVVNWKRVSLLVLIVVGGSISLLNAQLQRGTGIEASRDPAFSINILEATKGPNSKSFSRFVVCDDQLLVVRDFATGQKRRGFQFGLQGTASHERAVITIGGQLARKDILAGRHPVGQSVVISRGELAFFDMPSKSIVRFDPQRGRAKETFAGRSSLIESFGEFNDGNLIVVSRTMRPRPIWSYEEFDTGDPVKDLETMFAFRESLNGAHLFLTDPDLRVLKVLARRIEVVVPDNPGKLAGLGPAAKTPNVLQTDAAAGHHRRAFRA